MEALDEKAECLEQHRSKVNALMSQEIQVQRVKRGIWTPSTLKKLAKRKNRPYCDQILDDMKDDMKIERG